jgi:hypothetical protein
MRPGSRKGLLLVAQYITQQNTTINKDIYTEVITQVDHIATHRQTVNQHHAKRHLPRCDRQSELKRTIIHNNNNK